MTLLEVLIAVSILTVISALAFISIDNMVKAKSALNEHTEQLNQANLTYYLLQNDMQFAVSSQNSQLQEAEFVGNAQGFSLLQYKGQMVSSDRIEQARQLLNQPLQQVRWYIRNNQLWRSVTPSHHNGYSPNGQERPMLKVKTFSCSYTDDAGNNHSQWPNNEFENSRLPTIIRCLLETDRGLVSEFNLTPWQKI